MSKIGMITKPQYSSGAKVMVIDFPLNDLTDLTNPLEELARIAYFNVSFKQKLSDEGIVATYIAARCEQVSETG